MGRVGRRPTISVSSLLAGLTGITLIPLIILDGNIQFIWAHTYLHAFIKIFHYNTAPMIARSFLSILGKAAISIAYACVYVYTVELIPTRVRNVGIGFTSMNARIAGMIDPYVGGFLVY